MILLSTIRQLTIGFFCLVSLTNATAMIAQQHDKLVNYEYVGEFSNEQAEQLLQKIPPLETLKSRYSLKVYKIHYQTPAPNGEMTQASGLVTMPVSPEKAVGIVTYLHGTRVLRSDVPSNHEEKYDIYPAIFGSSGGYMVVMPDYLGLGDNDLPLHPYVDAETLASSSIDMLIAAKELANILDYPLNDNLFLAGYSEGGFTTMVMYESLLKNYKTSLPVTAAAAGSAPYDWNETLRFITQEPGPRSTVYLAYFYYSMQTYHHYWQRMDEIFVPPYDTLIPVLYDGQHQAPEILQALPQAPHLIFQDAFFQSIIDGSDKNIEQLKKNFNHYDFKSTSPLLLVGTKGDHDLSYRGAEIAYQRLKSLSDTVYIKHVSEVLDHIEAQPYVLKEQLAFFQQYDH